MRQWLSGTIIKVSNKGPRFESHIVVPRFTSLICEHSHCRGSTTPKAQTPTLLSTLTIRQDELHDKDGGNGGEEVARGEDEFIENNEAEGAAPELNIFLRSISNMNA